MKTYALIFCMLLSSVVNAQFLEKLGKKVEDKVRQRIDRKTDRAIDKGLDQAEDSLEGGSKGKAHSNGKEEGAEITSSSQADGIDDPFRIGSDFDFIAGDKVLFFEDFSADAIGDFPAKWNTNGSGEVVSINNQPGKFLKIPDNTLSFPEYGTVLPENFTVEFDLFYPAGTSRPPVTFGFADTRNPVKENLKSRKVFYFRISPSSVENIGYSTSLYSGRETVKSWPSNRMAGKPVHVSMAVNKQRIRLYMDQSKLFDLPRAFDQPALRNSFFFRAAELIPAPKDGFYITNLKIAESGIDARSELLKNGTYTTTGIYFNTNSASLKPESAGVLQELARILSENPDVRIKIIGHTDADGEAQHNLSLSQNRARAVKDVLTKNYGIDQARMETDGKGEASPAQPDDTAAGKAANRRVEFVKL